MKNQINEEKLEKAYHDQDLMNEMWYEEYQRLGGKHSFKDFLYYVDVFHAITMESYIEGSGPLTRQESMGKWFKFIGKYEGGRYFNAINNVTLYT